MTGRSSRVKALIGGVLTGDLSDVEKQELDDTRAQDPAIDAELEELRAVVARLDSAELSWQEEPVPPGFGERVLRAVFERGQGPIEHEK